MANLTITAANVVLAATGKKKEAIAGVAITAGQGIYLDASDSNKAKLADATSDAKADIDGIALNNAAAGQPLDYATDGVLTMGATLAVGTIYGVSATGGAICPVADLTTGNRVTILGVASTTAALKLGINASGVTKA